MKQKGYELRVVAGALKGRKLKYPVDAGLRPTMARTKASIFDAMGDVIRGRVFVDLYAGAGAMGIEALSRGASFAHFVENNRSTLRYLRENLTLCDKDSYVIHDEDVARYLDRNRLLEAQEQIVYADPPYADDVGLLLEFYDAMDYPIPELLVIEHRSQFEPPELTRLALLKSKAFGQTIASFFGEKDG